MNQLSKRQELILSIISQNDGISNKDINASLDGENSVSRVTLIRDLSQLTTLKLIQKIGQGRSIKYQITPNTQHRQPLNPSTYFDTPADKRQIIPRFNHNIFDTLKNIFTKEELKALDTQTQNYHQNKSKLPEEAIRREIERLTIELSWKSSEIEGNTYTLLDTEALIKENRQAPGKSKEETQMILNHKTALDYTFSYPSEFKTISPRKTEDLHTLLTKDLQITSGIRKNLVHIIGTNYKPLDNQHQIKDSLEKMTTHINKCQNPFEKSLLSLLLISYIQPFMDGNKRSARLTCNALLNTHNLCPLSYRSIDSVDYKKAILLFYEQNNLTYFKSLFMTQYHFATTQYFI